MDDGVIIVAEGRTEEGDGPPRHLGDGAGGCCELCPYALFGEGGHLGVRRAVRADLVPRLGNFLEIVGVFLRPELHAEEGCGNVRFAEGIQNGVGVLDAPRAVKGDRNVLILPLHTVDGEQARAAPKDFLRPRRPRRKGGERNGANERKSQYNGAQTDDHESLALSSGTAARGYIL